MPVQHLQIPVLPDRPRVHPMAGHLRRSYPVGKQNLSRACKGEELTFTITAQDALPDNLQARLITTLNSTREKVWAEDPFVRTDDRTLTCRITPEHAGLRSFRAEFSLDKGVTWLRDDVPDGWVLVDPPQVDGLRLYTFIPTISGTVVDWKNDLKRIQAMGFNAVHLLPITALDTYLLLRKTFEDEFVRQWSTYGVNAVSSLDVLPPTTPLNKVAVASIAKARGFDAVLVTRILNREKSSAGASESLPVFTDPSDAQNIDTVLQILLAPPDSVNDYDLATVECDLYDVASQQRDWSGITETKEMKSIPKLIPPFVKLILKHLYESPR